LLALLLCGGLTACGDEEQGDPGASAVPDRNASHRLSNDFELLRTPPDGIPADVRGTLQVPVPGMDWSLARRIEVPQPGSYWLAPGAQHLCIVATTPRSPAVGTVCATADQALRHGVANAAIDPASGRHPPP
jgi:hypothetical protein